MVRPAVGYSMRMFILVAGTVWITSACSSSHRASEPDTGTETVPDTGAETHADGNNANDADSGLCSEGRPRAPAGDAICAGVAECGVTLGQPDHQGCPNTCSCVCSSGQCFVRACTAIGGCTEPNAYR